MKPSPSQRADPGRRRVCLAGLAAGCAVPMRAARGATDALRMQLAPFLSPAALLNAFRPLREHLENHLARPVEMRTATDFRALIESTRRFEFDVAMLPAHLARLAISDWRYRQAAATLDSVEVLVLVRNDGPVRAAPALKGLRAGMLDAMSLTGTVGRRWLEQQGLAAEVEVVSLPSINSALFALDRGEVAMIVAGRSQLNGLPPSTPRSERVLAAIGDIPGPIFIARPAMADDELARLRAAMVAYRPDPAHAPSAAHSLLRLLDEARLAALEPYAAIARRALGSTR